ncbi:MAG: hypothetical protein CSA95_04080 [Bacteroidetes bacterium]|nr:MAG: hypothetical protein CSA95_04080 [Bacteroidota bacterium]
MIKIKSNSRDERLFSMTWELYRKSFPVEEQRPLNKHLQAMCNSKFHPYIYTTEEADLLAICFYWDFHDFKYLEHFSVNPNYRNRGIGSEIIRSFNEDKYPVILEIEPPIDEISKQRLKFYERNNFKETGYIFKQLKYQKNNKDVLLELLCNKEMNGDFFQKFQHTIYHELAIYCD